MSKVIVTADEVKKIAKLANLSLQDGETDLFASQFTQTIEVINELSEIETNNVSPTYQVNNLLNVTREDVVDQARVLPQDLAIREAHQTHKGFIVVDRIIDNS